MRVLFRPLPPELLPFNGWDAQPHLVPVDIPIHQDEVCRYLALPNDRGRGLQVYFSAEGAGFPGALFTVDTMGPHEKGRGGYLGEHVGPCTLRLWFSNLSNCPIQLGGAVLIERTSSCAAAGESRPDPQPETEDRSVGNGFVITQPVGNCDGSGRYAYDPSVESGRGKKLTTRCPGCRACC